MDRLKKLNGSMIAAIVLSVLLIMSLSAGATLAWFGSRDSASTSLTMGEAVVVTISESYKQGEQKLAMELPVTEGGLLPGMSVNPNVKVQLQKSNTNAILRARFITTVEYPDNYIDAAYSNTTKYPDKNANAAEGSKVTTSGRVLDETAFPDDNVYAGYMYYDYYNYLGQRQKYNYKEGTQGTENEEIESITLIDQTTADLATTEEAKALADRDQTIIDAAHTKKVMLSRVKVRDSIIAKFKSADDKNWPINGVSVPLTEHNLAEVEMRQRSIDLTDAINRVLQGQAGYKVDPVTGNLVSGTNGVKYTRRVADGWAYRDADQAWYYLGSSTNGFVITDNTSGVSEVVNTGKPIAKDIVHYKETTVGEQGKKVMTPVYLGVSDEKNIYDNLKVTGEGSRPTRDDKRNYLGGDKTDNSIDRIANEIGVLNQKTMASIDLSQGDVNIDFLTKRFVLPTFIDNSYAQAKVTFNFTVEAVQDYLVDPLQESTAAADRLPNNLVNGILVFNNAFPQTLYPKTTDKIDTLRATGSTANIIPGGGEKVSWNDATTNTKGLTTVVYPTTPEDTKEESLFSQGYLADTTIGVSDIGCGTYAESATTPTEGRPTTNAYTSAGNDGIKGGTNAADDKTHTSEITGFGVKQDEYGDWVADYTKKGWYVRGTASSLGISPYLNPGTAPAA